MSDPTVLVITGLPGTGKSTLADHVAKVLGTPSFSGDWILGAIAPSKVLDGVDRSTTMGIYERMLRTLFTRQLMLGQSAVLDCVASDAILAEWAAAATELSGRLLVVECICSDERIHKSRIQGRVRGIPGWHEIDWDHVEFMKRETPPLATERLVVDAVQPFEQNLSAILDYVGITSRRL